jgi:hypothetical protein
MSIGEVMVEKHRFGSWWSADQTTDPSLHYGDHQHLATPPPQLSMEYSNNQLTNRVQQGGRNRAGPMSIEFLWGKLLHEMSDFARGGAQIGPPIPRFTVENTISWQHHHPNYEWNILITW